MLTRIEPVFVEFIPEELEYGKLYLAPQYRAVMHQCCCGCGAKISTPLHPTGWTMTFDGEVVSLNPSVGNWSEKCQSHYVIRNNKVIWGRTLPRWRVEQIRNERHEDIAAYYGESDHTTQAADDADIAAHDKAPDHTTREADDAWWRRVLRRLGIRC